MDVPERTSSDSAHQDTASRRPAPSAQGFEEDHLQNKWTEISVPEEDARIDVLVRFQFSTLDSCLVLSAHMMKPSPLILFGPMQLPEFLSVIFKSEGDIYAYIREVIGPEASCLCPMELEVLLERNAAEGHPASLVALGWLESTLLGMTGRCRYLWTRSLKGRHKSPNTMVDAVLGLALDTLVDPHDEEKGFALLLNDVLQVPYCLILNASLALLSHYIARNSEIAEDCI